MQSGRAGERLMETHAGGGSKGGKDSSEDADERLNDELPEYFLGVVCGLSFDWLDRIANHLHHKLCIKT